jgi:hypothetical protein
MDIFVLKLADEPLVYVVLSVPTVESVISLISQSPCTPFIAVDVSVGSNLNTELAQAELAELLPL